MQAQFDGKKKLVTGLGLAGGAALLGAGIATGGLGLAVAGGIGMLAGGLYGGYHAWRDRKEQRYQRQQAQPIPDDMHFVWVGGKVPEERLENIRQWRERAGGVQPHLWLDEGSEEATADHLRGLEEAGVRIRRISELERGNRRFQGARQLLPTHDRHRGVNPGAAGALSDIARLEILHREGGHYMDSDNTPGAVSHRFAGMRGPLGFRLGWGRHEKVESFSNDAISANPGNRFIGDYLDSAYRNLTPRRARDIGSRDAERVKHAVMSTTGPRAMADVLFPLPRERAGLVRQEADERIRANELSDRETARLGIGLFPMNRELGGGRFSQQVSTLHDDLSYPSTHFNRGLTGSWVPNEGSSASREEAREEDKLLTRKTS